MGKLFRPLVFFITFLILLITEILRRREGAPSLLADNFPMWFLYMLVCLMFLSVVGTLYMRKRTIRKHEAILEDVNLDTDFNLDKGEYFYQAPIYEADGQRIRIFGGEEITYSLHFNNSFERWFAITVPLPIYGIHLKSKRHEIIIKCDKIFSFKFHYSIFVDGEFFGKLSNHRLTTKDGISQLLPFYVQDAAHRYSVKNPYGSLTTDILKDDQIKLLDGKRSFLDLSKSEKTNMRGEEHTLKVYDDENPDELWLAVYGFCMILKNRSS